MKEAIKQFIKKNKNEIITCGGVIGTLITGLIVAILVSGCSSSMHMQVKQRQGDIEQETTIESETKIKEVSLYFINQIE